MENEIITKGEGVRGTWASQRVKSLATLIVFVTAP